MLCSLWALLRESKPYKLQVNAQVRTQLLYMHRATVSQLYLKPTIQSYVIHTFTCLSYTVSIWEYDLAKSLGT